MALRRLKSGSQALDHGRRCCRGPMLFHIRLRTDGISLLPQVQWTATSDLKNYIPRIRFHFERSTNNNQGTTPNTNLENAATAADAHARSAPNPPSRHLRSRTRASKTLLQSHRPRRARILSALRRQRSHGRRVPTTHLQALWRTRQALFEKLPNMAEVQAVSSARPQ